MAPRFIIAGIVNTSKQRFVGLGGGASPSAPAIDNHLYYLFLKGEEADESQYIHDDGFYSHACVAVGDAKNDTAQSYFGSGSLYFDGTGDYLTISQNDTMFETTSLDSMTWEAWVRPSTTSGLDCIYSQYQDTSNHFVIQRSGTAYQCIFRSGGTALFTMTQSGLAATNTWAHVRVTRDGSNWELFVDGNSVGTATESTTLTGSWDLYVGALGAGTSPWQGWIDHMTVLGDTVLSSDPTVALAGPTGMAGSGEYAMLADKRREGDLAGTPSAGRNTRVLNTVVDDASFVTLAGNSQFTLSAGDYYLKVSSPCYSRFAGGYKTFLYDVTGAADVEIGSTIVGKDDNLNSELGAYISIVSDNVYEVQYEMGTPSTNRLGNAGTYGEEQYTFVEIWRVS